MLGLLEAMAAALEEVDSVAARYRPPVESPSRGSGRRRGLTSDCIGLLLAQEKERDWNSVYEEVLERIQGNDKCVCVASNGDDVVGSNDP